MGGEQVLRVYYERTFDSNTQRKLSGKIVEIQLAEGVGPFENRFHVVDSSPTSSRVSSAWSRGTVIQRTTTSSKPSSK